MPNKQFIVIQENSMGHLAFSVYSELKPAIDFYGNVKLNVFDRMKYIVETEEGSVVSKNFMSRTKEPFTGSKALDQDMYVMVRVNKGDDD